MVKAKPQGKATKEGLIPRHPKQPKHGREGSKGPRGPEPWGTQQWTMHPAGPGGSNPVSAPVGKQES